MQKSTNCGIRFAHRFASLATASSCPIAESSRVEPVRQKMAGPIGHRREKKEMKRDKLQNIYTKFNLQSKPAEVDEVVQMGFPPVLVFSSIHPISKSKPGRRVAGPFWAQAVNQKRQYLQIRIYKSLHFRPCRSCRKSQKVPTMLFCPVRIPSNARVVCSDRRL